MYTRRISSKVLPAIALGATYLVLAGCVARREPQAVAWILSKEDTRQAWEHHREQRTASRAHKRAGTLWAAAVVCWETTRCEGDRIEGQVTNRSLTGVALEFLDAIGRMYSRFDGLAAESYSLDVIESVHGQAVFQPR
jgi:uncharacterized membrane protein YbaN (DUF454 family)